MNITLPVGARVRILPPCTFEGKLGYIVGMQTRTTWSYFVKVDDDGDGPRQVIVNRRYVARHYDATNDIDVYPMELREVMP